MKYYMVTDQEKVIWGVGLTKSEARKDARKSLKTNYYEDIVLSKAIECDKELYTYAFKYGCGENDTWTIVNGIARLNKFIEKDEKKKAIIHFKNLDLCDKLSAIYEKLMEK